MSNKSMGNVALELICNIQCGNYINDQGENLRDTEYFKEYSSYVKSQLDAEVNTNV